MSAFMYVCMCVYVCKYVCLPRRGSTPVCIDACASINLPGASFDIKVHRSMSNIVIKVHRSDLEAGSAPSGAGSHRFASMHVHRSITEMHRFISKCIGQLFKSKLVILLYCKVRNISEVKFTASIHFSIIANHNIRV